MVYCLLHGAHYIKLYLAHCILHGAHYITLYLVHCILHGVHYSTLHLANFFGQSQSIGKINQFFSGKNIIKKRYFWEETIETDSLFNEGGED